MKFAGTFNAVEFVYKLTLCGLLCVSTSVAATEYYLIEDAGPTYSDFYEKPARTKYMEKNWGKVIPPAIKEKALLNNDSPYYKPTKGDVGVLVSDLGSKEKKLILDVNGNLVLIGTSGVKKVSPQSYEDFKANASNFAAELFGLKLGQTTHEEAVSILEKNGARFDAELYYKGYADIRIIRIENYKLLPVVNGRAPSKSYLLFVDNKLYQISVEWLRKSNFITEIDAIRDISNSIGAALEEKYKRECRSPDDGSHGCQLWLNPQRHITETWHSDEEHQLAQIVISYNDSSLLDQAIKIKREIDADVLQKEKEKENKRIQDMGKQL